MKKIDNSKLEQLSKRELIEYIKKLDQTNDFGLVWESHEEDIVNNLQKKLPILTEVKKNKIQNDKNNSSNIIIEGDNYDSLSILNYTHQGKIDVIFIDPPYNTGKEFLYNDKLINLTDDYSLSKWLSFMTMRLELAKNLMK